MVAQGGGKNRANLQYNTTTIVVYIRADIRAKIALFHACVTDILHAYILRAQYIESI